MTKTPLFYFATRSFIGDHSRSVVSTMAWVLYGTAGSAGRIPDRQIALDLHPVRVDVGGGPPVLEVSVSLLVNMTGDSDRCTCARTQGKLSICR